MTPAKARALFRTTDVATTAGFSAGFAQANLIALEKKYAFDFLLFAQRNPKPCPLLAGGDIRTDIPSYRVFSHGSLIDEPTDATAYWTENTVAFVIGCSFTFEQALLDNNVPVAHFEQG